MAAGDWGGRTMGGVTEGVAPAGPQGEAQPGSATVIAARRCSASFGERAKAGYSAGLKGESA